MTGMAREEKKPKSFQNNFFQKKSAPIPPGKGIDLSLAYDFGLCPTAQCPPTLDIELGTLPTGFSSKDICISIRNPLDYQNLGYI